MNAFWWAVFTACIWGVVPVMEKFGLSKISPFTALFYRCLGVIIGIIMLSIFIVRPADLKSVEPRAMLMLICAGFLASFVAQITFYHGLKMGEMSRVVPIAGAYPLIAFLFGIFLLGESVTAGKITGVVLIISGMWLLR